MDAIVATVESTDAATIAASLGGLRDLEVTPLLDRAPLHWTRIRSATPASHLDVAGLLARSPVRVRYIAPACRSTMVLPPALDFARAKHATGDGWPTRPPRSGAEPPPEGARWFLGEQGVQVERDVCGTGAGVRLAFVEDDAADVALLDLERVVRLGVEQLPSGSGHAALMVGWAVGAVRPDGKRFAGVAPDASPRLYCIPKPSEEVVWLPLAIASAVLDGADVVVCATYTEGTTSPMLDDALQVASHLGRRGRGTPVVLPTGRETSSPHGSLHASLTLALGDPASDPRVHCIAPGGRDGGWFLWKDGQGALRPFANRGPAVRWLAPGDDLAYPFAARERLFHAESSGAAAIASGVMALVLACNPTLRLRELHAVLARTAQPARPVEVPSEALADPAEVLPWGRDRDGHDAKCGYGRLHASRACACALDPFALALSAMGEDAAAAAWCARDDRVYSRRLARWAVRALLARPDLEHAVRVVARHARLVAVSPSRERAHAPGALARHLGLVVRELARRPAPRAVRDELQRARDALSRGSEGAGPFGTALEEAALRLSREAWRKE